jgi:hypothetical protein
MGRIEAGSFISISGKVLAVEDISAVAWTGSFLIIGADEAVGADGNENYIQLLQKTKNGYAVHKDILLLQGDETEGNELDIEGIAAEGDYVYVIGGHCLKREKVKQTRTQKKNRKKFHADKMIEERNRYWLYRIKIDSKGNKLKRQKITLREIITNDPALHPFSHIPSKENGVDLEGIATRDGWLYAGFRGPVFRENYVPVLRLQFNAPEKNYQLLYVQLGGRGIRDITTVSDGFLLLAGPVGDGTDSYQVYHWNGKDMIPGNDLKKRERGALHLLGELTPPPNGKVEGITVLREKEAEYQLIIAYDGAENKNAALRHFRVPRP